VIRPVPAGANAPYVTALRVDGEAWTKPWLPESFVSGGGTLGFRLSGSPDRAWGARPEDAPPSFSHVGLRPTPRLGR